MGCAASGVQGAEAQMEEVVENTALDRQNFYKRFILQGKLGQGSYAQVRVACPADCPGAPVAVKIMDLRRQPGKDAPDQKAAASWSRQALRTYQGEVGIMERLASEPTCVRLQAAFLEEDGVGFLVLEKCDRTLKQALESCELTEEVMRRLSRGMFRAIAAVHAKGIVHRDVKPDNFLCSGEDNMVKLCDFGMAAALPKGLAGGEQQLRGLCGTPPYMAPEMLQGHRYGVKVDVWAVGIVSYVLLFGAFPYRPEKATPDSMKQAILRGGMLDTVSPSVPCAASTLLRDTLCRVPIERPTAEKVLSVGWLAEQDREACRAGRAEGCWKSTLKAVKALGVFTAQDDCKHTPLDDYLMQSQQQALAQRLRGSEMARLHSSTTPPSTPRKQHIEATLSGASTTASRLSGGARSVDAESSLADSSLESRRQAVPAATALHCV